MSEPDMDRRARLRNVLVKAGRDERASSSLCATLTAIALTGTAVAAPSPASSDAPAVGKADSVPASGPAPTSTATAAAKGAVGWKPFAVLLALGAAGAGALLFENREPVPTAPPVTVSAPADRLLAPFTTAPLPTAPAAAPAEIASVSVDDLPSVKSSPTARAAPPPQPAVAPVAPVASTLASESPAARLAEETRAIGAIRAAVHARNTTDALRLLDGYEAQFPSGVLAEDAQILRIESLALAGRRAEAAQRADRFLLERPSSGYASRVRTMKERLSEPDHEQ